MDIHKISIRWIIATEGILYKDNMQQLFAKLGNEQSTNN